MLPGNSDFDIGAKLLSVSRRLVCSLSEYSELKGHVAPDRFEVAVSSKKNGADVVGGQSSSVDLLEGGVE